MSSILTPTAAAKLKALRAQAEDLNALANTATRRAGERRSTMAFAPAPPDAENRSPDAMSAEAVERQAEVDRLQSYAGVQHAKANAALQLCVQIDHFLTTLPPDTRLIDAKPVTLPKLDDQNFQNTVGEVRRKIGELSTALTSLGRAGPTKKERHQAARKYVDGLIAKARPTIRVSHNKFEITWGVDGSLSSKAVNAAALAAWTSPDAFLESIIEALDAMPEPAHVMTAEAKQTEADAIRKELLAQERVEEACIEQAALHDMSIPRRVMANPLAVLGLEIVSAAKATAA